jgi:hypothetical protein
MELKGNLKQFSWKNCQSDRYTSQDPFKRRRTMGGISGLLAPDAIVEMKIVEWNKVLGNCLFLLDKKGRKCAERTMPHKRMPSTFN